MTKVSEIFKLEREIINPSKNKKKIFRYYSIPSFDLNPNYEDEVGDNIKSIKFKVPSHSILISKINPRIPRIVIINETPEDSICSTEFAVLKLREDKFKGFLDYFIALFYSNSFYEYSKSHVTGTSGSHQRIKAEDILDFDFNLPSVEEINKINKIYKTIQNKFNTNKNTINLIDNVGTLLFTYQFLGERGSQNFKELGDFIEVIRGCSYRSEDLNGHDFGLVNINCFNIGGGFKIDGIKPFSGKYNKSHLLNEGDIIISKTDITQRGDILGRALLIPIHLDYKKLVGSLDIGIIRKKNEYLSNAFLYFLFNSEDFQKYILGYANGTTVLHLDQKGVTNYMFDVPSKEKIDKFNKIMNSLLKVYGMKIVENQRLLLVKDNLLKSFF